MSVEKLRPKREGSKDKSLGVTTVSVLTHSQASHREARGLLTSGTKVRTSNVLSTPSRVVANVLIILSNRMLVSDHSN
jgi:hypothetical protein